MLMRIILIFAFVIFCFEGSYSQTNNFDFKNLPIAPESANLGKFGMNDLNSSSGQMNFNLPIYTIDIANTNLNISLNYNYSGLILKEKPSMVGMGWTMIATGVINREVRGLPDEHKKGYYGINSKRNVIINYANTGEIDLNDLQSFEKKEYDSEADKYTVSLFGMNFSFKLDSNSNPIYLSKHSNKVTITKNQFRPEIIDSFSVTDDKGVIYTFNGKEYTIPEENEEFVENLTDTSWKLTRIQYPNSQNIVFQYREKVIQNYDFVAAGTNVLVNETPPYVYPKYGEKNIKSTISSKILEKITFPKGIIYFKTVDIDDNTMYSSVDIVNVFNDTVEKYDFKFYGNRSLLTEVLKNNSTYYQFNYYDQDFLPNFLKSSTDKALDQDRWGYFNLNGNSNLYALNIPDSQFQANLEPNFYSTKKGALKRIIYPTKGYTEIEYEGNEIVTNGLSASTYYENVEFGPKKYKLRLDGNYGDSTLPQHKEVETVLTFQYPTVMNIKHTISGIRNNSHIEMRIDKIDANGCSMSQFYPPDFSIPRINGVNFNYGPYTRDLSNAIRQYNNGNPASFINPNTPFLCPSLIETYGPDDPGPDTVSDSVNRVIVAPGTYRFSILTNFAGTTFAYGLFEFEIQKNYHLAPPTFVNQKVGGIRVARQINYDKDASKALEIKYDYNSSNGYSSGVLNVTPLNSKKYEIFSVGYKNGGSSSRTDYVYSTKIYSALDPSFGSPVYYTSIKEKIIGSSDVGYKIKTYQPPVDINNGNSVPMGQDLTKEKVLSQETYSSSVENKLLNSIKNNYQLFKGNFLPNSQIDSNISHPYSLVVSKKPYIVSNVADPIPANPTNPDHIAKLKSNYDLKLYKELDTEFRIYASEQNDFLSDTVITVKQEYKFDVQNPDKLISKMVKNSNSEFLETKYFYSDDFLNEPLINELRRANRINTPILTEQYRAGTLISKSKTTFAVDNPINNLLLPKEEYSAKFPNTLPSISNIGNLEKKVTYDQYDNKGNIQQYTLESGVPISIIWGYNNTLVVAKVEGVAYSSIQSNLITAIQTATDSATATEAQVITALNALRSNLTNAMVTTFTHKPLIGVSTITDPKGLKTTYEYDSFNRLKYVKDQNDNILQKYCYNYKGEIVNCQ